MTPKDGFFTDEKFFDLDGIYNTLNDRVWAVNREEADKKDGVHEKNKFPVKVMVWLCVCGQRLTKPVILEDGTMDHERYIDEVPPIALKSGNKMLGKQLDVSARWCATSYSSLESKMVC